MIVNLSFACSTETAIDYCIHKLCVSFLFPSAILLFIFLSEVAFFSFSLKNNKNE